MSELSDRLEKAEITDFSARCITQYKSIGRSKKSARDAPARLGVGARPGNPGSITE